MMLQGSWCWLWRNRSPIASSPGSLGEAEAISHGVDPVDLGDWISRSPKRGVGDHPNQHVPPSFELAPFGVLWRLGA